MTPFIEKLIRYLEEKPELTRHRMRLDWSSFPNAKEAEATRIEVGVLCDCGALKATYGKRGFKHTIEAVSILDASKLYEHFGKRTQKEIAREASEGLRLEAESWETAVIDNIEKAWATHRKWMGFAISDASSVPPIQKLARGLRSGLNEGLDMRTFSTRHGGDSKLLEQNEPALLAYLYHNQEKPSGTLREIMARNGSAKITLPVFISGPFSQRGCPVGMAMDYCGVPIHELEHFHLDSKPEYVLTIENLVSFHRHAAEINTDRKGLVLFTSGQAAKAFMSFYAGLVEKLPDVDFYHWSDIDAGGLDITKSIMSLNPKVLPHLMSLELVTAHGARTSVPVGDCDRFAGTWMETIAKYLVDGENKTLEQEMFDPQLPQRINGTAP